MKEQFESIKNVISEEVSVFTSPRANFHRARDETSEGYVTFVSRGECLREIMIDTTEAAPTFSTNPPRATSEKGQKEAELRAYLAEPVGNSEAWSVLIGRSLSGEEEEQTSEFLVTAGSPPSSQNNVSVVNGGDGDCDESGYGSYYKRPCGVGNLTIAVLKGIVLFISLFAFSFCFVVVFSLF